MPGMVTQALVRGIPDTYDRCIQLPGAGAIDVALARTQHDQYREFLGGQGLEVTRLDADERYPDCCFVEDTAVVAGGVAAICRSGAVSRRGETDAVAGVLAGRLAVVPIVDPGTIDGGDVLRLGNRVYVGRTERTNEAGIIQLRDALLPAGFETIAVDNLRVLHLKSACTPLGDDTVLACPADVDTSVFAGARVVEVPSDERYAANCLFVNGVVLVAEGYAETRKRIEAAGFETRAIEVSEFRKGWGSLTCLSILL